MDRITQLNLMLDDVGKRDGIHGLKLAPDGTGGMELKNGTQVYFEYVESDDSLCIYTPLMEFPQDEKKRLLLFDAMLDCNFLLKGDGSLAIAHHLEQAVYRICHDVRDLDANRIDDTIDMVLKQRDEMISRLEHGSRQSQGKRAESVSTSASTFQRLAGMSLSPSSSRRP